jgi:Na+-transporting methylmalonyl-CoA/oxaloacetate decarboxylase beta subunit
MDIGIIGGADGPTSIYITSGSGSYIVISAIVLCIAVVGYIVYRKRKNSAKK